MHFFCTASIPNTAVVDLSKEMDIKVLPINENVKKRLIDTNTTYTESVIQLVHIQDKKKI